MGINEILDDPLIRPLLWPMAIGIVGGICFIFVIRAWRKSSKISRDQATEIVHLKHDHSALRDQLRQRIIDNVNLLARVIQLNPVIPGNTPEDNTLEGRNRARCLSMIIDGLPRDTKGQGIRMAEFLHELCDYLVKAYGKEEVTTIKIDAHPVILDVESAASVGLMLNELVSNALQYAPEPGQKSKVNIFFKERDGKLVIIVGDNGIGMKSPYIPKFSFGLQLTHTLVKRHKGEMIFSSRPGTRVEILLPEYNKAIREVFITPTTRVH